MPLAATIRTLDVAALRDLAGRPGSALDEARAVVAPSRLPIVLATIGIDLLALALPIFILQVYDRVLPNQTATTLGVLILGLAAALVAEIALRLLRSRVATWTAARLEHVLRYRAVASLLQAPLPAFQQKTPAAYVESLNSILTLRDFEASQRLEIRVDLCFALFYLALIAYLGAWLVLVPLTLLALFAATALLVGRMLHESVAARMAADKRRYDLLMKVLSGILTVKALALNGIVLRRQEALQEASARAIQDVIFRGAVAQTMTVLFAQLNTVALLGCGALLVLNGSLSMGALAACTLLSGRALQPIQMAMGIWANFQSIRIARDEIADIMRLPREAQADAARPELHGLIEFDRVTFRHAPGGAPLLDGLSLRAQPGEIIGIEGASGSGKTTLFHLLLGLVRPESGAIRIDGLDVGAIAPDCLRRQSALLARHGVVYSGTILDNLSNFRDGESVNEALYLAFLLGLDEPIRRLPAGFDTQVEGGDALPAGLRQRIAIVRELVNRPKLILFDEAEHGLDVDSRTRLITLMRELGGSAALIVISSSPDVLALTSRRYRLSGGRLLPISQTGGARIQEVAP